MNQPQDAVEAKSSKDLAPAKVRIVWKKVSSRGEDIRSGHK